MKLLFDQNLSFRLCRALGDVFPNSSQVRRLGMDEASDVKIWEYALHHDYLIVTQDADFYDLSLLHEAPPKLLWLRCGNQPTWVIEGLIRHHQKEVLEFAEDPSLSCLELY